MSTQLSLNLSLIRQSIPSSRWTGVACALVTRGRAVKDSGLARTSLEGPSLHHREAKSIQNHNEVEEHSWAKLFIPRHRTHVPSACAHGCQISHQQTPKKRVPQQAHQQRCNAAHRRTHPPGICAARQGARGWAWLPWQPPAEQAAGIPPLPSRHLHHWGAGPREECQSTAAVLAGERAGRGMPGSMRKKRRQNLPKAS